MTIRLVTVVGARPEFVQVGAIARAIDTSFGSSIDYHLIHTGQHYDTNMSQDFFDELGLPEPARHLGVGSESPAVQVGEMITRLDGALRDLEPDVVMVFGDTNSTLAGALAASKLGVPLAHVESGLRSFNRAMPEEMNRRVTDHLASILFCPSENAVANLSSEGIFEGVHLTGDVMYESMLHTLSHRGDPDEVLRRLGLTGGEYAVATTHRTENTDSPERLNQIVLGLSDFASSGIEIVFPIHPRTRSRLELTLTPSSVRLIDPMSHSETLTLLENAALLLTDSGGLQKESYWLGTPCVTMRDQTEWVETVANGWNRLTGADRRRIANVAHEMLAGPLPERPPLYGEGTAVTTAILDRLMADIGVLAGAEAS